MAKISEELIERLFRSIDDSELAYRRVNRAPERKDLIDDLFFKLGGSINELITCCTDIALRYDVEIYKQPPPEKPTTYSFSEAFELLRDSIQELTCPPKIVEIKHPGSERPLKIEVNFNSDTFPRLSFRKVVSAVDNLYAHVMVYCRTESFNVDYSRYNKKD